MNWADIASNGIFQAVAGAIIFAVLVWLYKKALFWGDEKKIYNFIKQSTNRFRSTEAISAKTHIPPSRIEVVASKSKRIRRNSKEKESWCLSEKI